MAKEIKVPNIGDFQGVEVIDVLVAEGDSINQEDPLITLESDKAAMDVPSPVTGKVKELKIKVGDKVSEGDVILVVEEDGGDAREEKKTSQPESKGDKESGPRPSGEGRLKAKDEGKQSELPEGSVPSGGYPERPAPGTAPITATPPTVDQVVQVSAHAGPSVRKFARELGVDLSRVKGSGYKNRITHEDVKRFVKAALRGGAAAGGALPAVPEVDFARFGEVERRPRSRIKRISGPRLQAAWINAPHVTQHDEADITLLEKVRKAMNENAGEGHARITPLAFLVRAVVLAMQAYPDTNSALDATGENLIVRKYFHIGFAVDTEQGLVVPVIRNADQKTLRDIAEELATLAEKARSGKLKRDEIEGGCFSITSLGGIGGTAFTPIVNAPEVAILGVSRAEMKPKWNGHDFEPRLMLPLSLSYDHRVIDGAMAVRFTRHLAGTLETLRGFVR